MAGFLLCAFAAGATDRSEEGGAELFEKKDYEAAAAAFEKELERRAGIIKKKQKQMEPFSFEWLKKKYPLHFLLFNLLDRDK